MKRERIGGMRCPSFCGKFEAGAVLCRLAIFGYWYSLGSLAFSGVFFRKFVAKRFISLFLLDAATF